MFLLKNFLKCAVLVLLFASESLASLSRDLEVIISQLNHGIASRDDDISKSDESQKTEILQFVQRHNRHGSDPVLGSHGPKPPPCADGTLWASHHSNCSYPYDAIRYWIRENKHEFRRLYNSVPVFRESPPGKFPKVHNDLCRHVEGYPLLTWSYSYELGWVPLVQIKQYKQYFYVQYCVEEMCSVDLPGARCKSSQSRHRVLVWNGAKVVPTTILLASSCQCSRDGYNGDGGYDVKYTPAYVSRYSPPDRSIRTTDNLSVLRPPVFSPPIYRPNDFISPLGQRHHESQKPGFPVLDEQQQQELQTPSEKFNVITQQEQLPQQTEQPQSTSVCTSCNFHSHPTCCDPCQWGAWCADPVWRHLTQVERLKRKRDGFGSVDNQQDVIDKEQSSADGCVKCDYALDSTCCDPCRWGAWCADAVWKYLTEDQRKERKQAEASG